MSLQLAAQHLAAQGRGPDTTLVHMAPGEVQSLQAIAKAHGGSLTINPETGLPEAGFLSSILPMVVGAGLSMIPGVGPLMAAGIVGGGTTLATGSLEKGLMAGLGAYGGAGLAGSVMNAGAGAITSAADAAAAGAGAGVDTASQFMLEGARPDALMAPQVGGPINLALPQGTPLGPLDPQLSAEAQSLLNRYPAPITPPIPADPNFAALNVPVTPAMPTVPSRVPLPDVRNQMDIASDRAAALRQAGPMGTAKAGLGALMEKPGQFMTKQNLQYGMAAAAPILGATPTVKGPPTDDTARIRDYVYDPISGTYTYIGARKPSEVAEQGPIRRAASGGVMRYADEGLVQDSTNAAPSSAAGQQPTTVQQLYQQVLGREADPTGLANWTSAFGSTVDPTEYQRFLTEAQPELAYRASNAAPAPAAPAAPAASATAVFDTAAQLPMSTAAAEPTSAQQQTITNIYQNALGRDPDPVGLNYWSSRLAQGAPLEQVYAEMQGSARSVLGERASELAPNLSKSVTDVAGMYGGYKSPDTTSIGDEWVRNILGREATAADKSQDWYKMANTFRTDAGTEAAYEGFLSTYGIKDKNAPSWFEAAQLRAPKTLRTTAATTGDLPGYTLGNTGIGSGLVRPEELAGKTTDWKPGSAGIPTMQDVVNAYTQGGGLTGRLPYVPRSLAEQEALYNRLTGESSRAYDYLMGRGAYPRAPATAQIMRPYGEAVLGLPASTYNQKYVFDPATQRYIPNPNYKAPVDPGAVAKTKEAADKAKEDEAAAAVRTGFSDGAANGGVMRGYAGGGISHLGDYSDGGRLLRGPGDGVSDSIPATIANKRPARLADGEFVVPARIVSELGNGSTEAGARKLYAMMNRIQSNRSKSVGKGKVAVNSKSDKYLPA